MKVIPYISVLNAKKTFKIYEDLFGAKLLSSVPFEKAMGQQFGFPADYDYANSTMHAEFKIGEFLVYISDFTTKKPESEGPVELLLELDSKEQADKIWAKIKAKKYRITMELQQTFWGSYYGRFIDEDGIGWELNFPMPQTATPKATIEKKISSKVKKTTKVK